MSSVTAPENRGNGYNPRDELTLRELRQARELSLRDVETLSGISRATLSKIERGIEIPKPAHLVRLSELYKVDAGAWRLAIEYRINGQEAANE